jgi:hypothetical protein
MLQGHADDLGRVDDAGLEQVAILVGLGVVAVGVVVLVEQWILGDDQFTSLRTRRLPAAISSLKARASPRSRNPLMRSPPLHPGTHVLEDCLKTWLGMRVAHDLWHAKLRRANLRVIVFRQRWAPSVRRKGLNPDRRLLDVSEPNR